MNLPLLTIEHLYSEDNGVRNSAVLLSILAKDFRFFQQLPRNNFKYVTFLKALTTR